MINEPFDPRYIYEPEDNTTTTSTSRSNPHQKHVKLTGEIIAETPKAILLRSKVGTELTEMWLPLSQVSKIVRAFDATDGTELDEVHVAAWLANKKGF